MRALHRWGVFNLIGSTGFVLQMATVAILARVFGWHYGLATAAGVELAILNNFLWHTRYTWRDRPAGAVERLRRFWRYQLAKTVTLVLSVAKTAWFVSVAGVPVEIANVLAVMALSVVNFAISDRLVFRAPREPGPGRSASRRCSRSERPADAGPAGAGEVLQRPAN